jgi:hypothetical protein
MSWERCHHKTIRMSSVTWARTSSMCAPYCSMLYRHTNLDIDQVRGTPQRRAETQGLKITHQM